jgi:hypothetical protein
MAILSVGGTTVSNATAGNLLSMPVETLTFGNFIVVTVAILTPSISVSSIVDSASNTYTLQSAINNGSSIRSEIWTAPILSSTGSQTVVVNLSGNTLASAAYEMFSGVTSGSFNVGSSIGSNSIPEGFVATQDSNNYVITGVSVATTSGATFSEVGGVTTNILQSIVPSLTSASSALLSNTTYIPCTISTIVTLSSSFSWATTSIELRSGSATSSVTSGKAFAGSTRDNARIDTSAKSAIAEIPVISSGGSFVFIS